METAPETLTSRDLAPNAVHPSVTPSALVGLSDAEAARRLSNYGENAFAERSNTALAIAVRQMRSPILALLVTTALAAIALGDTHDGAIVLGIIVMSVGLGFFNDYRSEATMRDLRKRVQHQASVLRNGTIQRLPVRLVVPGDVVDLSVGDVVPADVLVLQAEHLACSEAILTGEAAPVSKDVAASGDTVRAYMGTVVHSGHARAVVESTGERTRLGKIASSIRRAPPITDFERGLGAFSRMLALVTLVLVIAMLAVSVLAGRPLLQSLLFAFAIAVGLTPQLMPAIVSTSLAAGARHLARARIIVMRLVSIEDFGNIDELFTDKTGTLTKGELAFARCVAVDGGGDAAVLQRALLAIGTNQRQNNSASAAFEAALRPVLATTPLPKVARVAALPFDYERKRSSVIVAYDGTRTEELTIGAPESVFACCSNVSDDARAALAGLYATGGRVLAVAMRVTAVGAAAITESNAVLCGYVLFADPIKADAASVLTRLRDLGITVRILTGDHADVARVVCERLEVPVRGILQGDEIDAYDDVALAARIPDTTIFARTSPEQKGRIVRLARAAGKTIGFLGDGVNDAVALHEADVGLSVDGAADVARDAADMIMLEKDLGVLADGVVEGRRIFANTVKYVLMATSSNFGNMFSAAAASLVLPFLPMTATQILLNNVLYDTSELTIPLDNVDLELLRRPAHWNVALIRGFMMFFGPISSLFDFVTFGMMLFVFHASVPLFQTGWFVESLVTQAFVIFVIRTQRVPFWKSRPGRWLALATGLVIGVACGLPFTPIAQYFGFVPLPAPFFAALLLIVTIYVTLVDLAKRKVSAHAATAI